jgi:hypothetical protein
MQNLRDACMPGTGAGGATYNPAMTLIHLCPFATGRPLCRQAGSPAPADERAGLHAPPRAGRSRLVRATSAMPALPNSSHSAPEHALTCWNLVRNFSEADGEAIKAIEKDHQPRRQGSGVLDQVQVRRPPELLAGRSSCTLPAPAKTSTTPAMPCNSRARATWFCCPRWMR